MKRCGGELTAYSEKPIEPIQACPTVKPEPLDQKNAKQSPTMRWNLREVVTVTIVVTGLLTVGLAGQMVLSGAPGRTSRQQALGTGFGEAWPWLLLIPVVLWLIGQVPFNAGRRWRAVAAHGGALAAALDFCALLRSHQPDIFGKHLVVQHDVTEQTMNALVPSLVLQPLVENSIKHGLENRRRTCGACFRRQRCRLPPQAFRQAAISAGIDQGTPLLGFERS